MADQNAVRGSSRVKAFSAQASVLIARPPEDVWAYLDDHARDSEWRPVKNIRQIGAGPVGPGTRFEGTVVAAGRDYAYVNELTQYDEPVLVAWRAVNASGWLIGREGSYALEPASGGTRLTFTLVYEPNSLAGSLVRLPASLLFKVALPQMVKQIKKGVERRPS